jgi:hypothetical protein
MPNAVFSVLFLRRCAAWDYYLRPVCDDDREIFAANVTMKRENFAANVTMKRENLRPM